MIGGAIELIVQQDRLEDGRRVVTAVAELGLQGRDVISTQTTLHLSSKAWILYHTRGSEGCSTSRDPGILIAQAMTYMRLSPVVFFSSVFVAIIVSLAWMARISLHSFASEHPAFFAAIVLGTCVLCLTFALVLALESSGLRRAWLERSAAVAGLEKLRPPAPIAAIMNLFPDPFELISRPIFRTSIGSRLQEEWLDAELGGRASRYILLLVLAALGGYTLGIRVGGVLLATALAILVPLLPRAMVRNRAETCRRRFGEQLPQVLEGLASGLSAGLAFEGAVEYVSQELPEPSRTIFTRLSRRLAMGTPIHEVLSRLQVEVGEEALSLVVDGLILQRQFGGDMVQMLEETAVLLRARIELDREVRAITAQGRLSGIVIAALVPVSAAFLLSFNPRYIDVLFDSVIGQGLIILALILQVIGWAVISRLVRINY